MQKQRIDQKEKQLDDQMKDIGEMKALLNHLVQVMQDQQSQIHQSQFPQCQITQEDDPDEQIRMEIQEAN